MEFVCQNVVRQPHKLIDQESLSTNTAISLFNFTWCKFGFWLSKIWHTLSYQLSELDNGSVTHDTWNTSSFSKVWFVTLVIRHYNNIVPYFVYLSTYRSKKIT